MGLTIWMLLGAPTLLILWSSETSAIFQDRSIWRKRVLKDAATNMVQNVDEIVRSIINLTEKDQKCAYWRYRKCRKVRIFPMPLYHNLDTVPQFL